MAGPVKKFKDWRAKPVNECMTEPNQNETNLLEHPLAPNFGHLTRIQCGKSCNKKVTCCKWSKHI